MSDEPITLIRIHPSTRPCKCPSGNIRTVKVTKSKAADNIATGESAVNDPNAMHKIQSPDPGDIKEVLTRSNTIASASI